MPQSGECTGRKGCHPDVGNQRSFHGISCDACSAAADSHSTSRCGRCLDRAAAAVHVVVPGWCVAVSSSTPALWSPRTRIHRILIPTRAPFRAEPGRSRGRSEVRIAVPAWPNSLRL
jgi:hypothetical protein